MRRAMVLATTALLAATGLASAQGMPALPPATPLQAPAPAPSLPPLPTAPATAAPVPTVARPVTNEAGDNNPAPACASQMITDKVFDYAAHAIQEAYKRSLYGKMMKVTETDSQGTQRKCSGELSDTDGSTYEMRYVVDKPSAQEVTIGYDFSHVKAPPRETAPAVPPTPTPQTPVAPPPGTQAAGQRQAP